MSCFSKVHLLALLVLPLPAFQTHLTAQTADAAKDALSKALLGKDVKALMDMPAYKDGIDLYVDAQDRQASG